MTGRNLARVDRDVISTATPGHDSLVVELQADEARGYFQPSSVFVVSNQEIGDAQRVEIKCAANTDAKLTQTATAKILNGT